MMHIPATLYLPDVSDGIFCHAVREFRQFTVRAKSVNGSTPGARVTWNTTIPAQCVTSVTVEFRNESSHGPVIATYNTTNTSGTEFIQTGLQCATNYYITAILSGKATLSTGGGLVPAFLSRLVQVFVGGKVVV